MVEQQVRSDRRSWIALAAESAVLVAAIVYAFLREQYRVFYSELKVTPDDVGLSPIAILSGSAFGLLEVAFAVAILATIGFGLFRLGGGVRRTQPAASRDPDEAPSRWSRNRGRLGLAALTAAFLLVVHVAVRATAHQAADCVSDGGTLRYVTVLGVPLLNVRAQEAKVEWLGRPNSPRPELGDRVLFLGQNDGIAVVYDVEAQAPVRVPATSAVIRIIAVKEGC